LALLEEILKPERFTEIFNICGFLTDYRFPMIKTRINMKDVFTTGEAAKICRVSQQTIIRCFDKGILGGYKVPGSRFRRIPRNDLIMYMTTYRIPMDRLEEAK
jgi:excisionase family DNA binding protein